MRAVFSFVVLMLIFCAGVLAQSGRRIKPTPTPERAESSKPQFSESIPKKKRARIMQTLRSGRGSADVDADAVVRVEASLITISLTVINEYGSYVTDLEQHNFTSSEDGKPREIAYFGTADKLLTVVLLLDPSPST